MRTTIDEQIKRITELLEGRARGARRLFEVADVQALAQDRQRLRGAFDQVAAQRDQWMRKANEAAAELEQWRKLYDGVAPQVATYSDAVPRLLSVVDLLLALLHEESFGRSLVQALRQGLEELRDLPLVMKTRAAEAPPNPHINGAARRQVEKLIEVVDPSAARADTNGHFVDAPAPAGARGSYAR